MDRFYATSLLLVLVINTISCSGSSDVFRFEGSYSSKASATMVDEQSSIFGTIYAKEDSVPVSGAYVDVLNSGIHVLTSDEGKFNIPINAGHYRLEYLRLVTQCYRISYRLIDQ